MNVVFMISSLILGIYAIIKSSSINKLDCTDSEYSNFLIVDDWVADNYCNL